MPLVDTSNPFLEDLNDKQKLTSAGADSQHPNARAETTNGDRYPTNFAGGDAATIGTWKNSDASRTPSGSPPKSVNLSQHSERLPVSARIGTPNAVPTTTNTATQAKEQQFDQHSQTRAPVLSRLTFSNSPNSPPYTAPGSSNATANSSGASSAARPNSNFDMTAGQGFPVISNWADEVRTPPETKSPQMSFRSNAHHPPASASSSAAPAVSSEEPQSALAKQSLLNKLINQRLVDVQLQYTQEIISEMDSLYLKDDKTGGKRRTWDEFNLKPQILRGLLDKHFDYPSRIQAMTLGDLLSSRNVMAQSQSGTGKTAAFAIAMLQAIDMNSNHVQALCLEPTMELAEQTAKVIEDIGKYMAPSNAAPHQVGIKVVRALKGIDMSGQPVQGQICVGTPGKTKDWLSKQRGALIMDPKYIRTFVLDEADVMLEMQGLGDQTHRIKTLLPQNCHLAFFSATYDARVKEFGQKVVGRDAATHFLEVANLSLDNIKQFYVRVPNRDAKYESLANLYGILSVNQCMIFCATRDNAQWLTQKLLSDNHEAELLSGDMDVADRTATLERFRQSKVRVLVTTNVSARGLDIVQINLVINFDMPMLHDTKRADCETYLHRIGRSGRFGRGGIAINYIMNERDEQIMREIEGHFQRRIEPLSTDDLQEIEDTIESYGKSAAPPRNNF